MSFYKKLIPNEKLQFGAFLFLVHVCFLIRTSPRMIINVIIKTMFSDEPQEIVPFDEVYLQSEDFPGGGKSINSDIMKREWDYFRQIRLPVIHWQ